MKKFAICALIALLGGFSVAAAPAKAFPKQPAAAVKYLKGEKGKPIRSGAVFVNGHYIPGPYTVTRIGTVIKINDRQVTGQIVSWNNFLSTQDPGVVDKKEIMPAEGGGDAPSSTPEPAKPAGGVDDLFDDFSGLAPSRSFAFLPATDALDDLFGDDDEEPVQPKKPSGGASTQRRPPPPPKPAGPIIVYTLKGAFEMNPRASAMLAKVKSVRTDIDKTLRDGGVCFFSTQYRRKLLNARLAQELISVLPEILKNAVSPAQIEANLRAKNIYYLDAPVCRELFAYRADYLQLQALREEMKRASQMRRYLTPGR